MHTYCGRHGKEPSCSSSIRDGGSATYGTDAIASMANLILKSDYHVVRSFGGQISEVVNTYWNLGETRNDGIQFGINCVTKEYDWGRLELEFSVEQSGYIFISESGPTVIPMSAL